MAGYGVQPATRGCTACCTSSQFIHVGPDEHETMARIPRELLFPAPGLPAGHHVMGYDEQGHCPMLVEGAGSIYEHRPRTCRPYDCRVFPATGVALDEPAKATIADRSQRWRFSHPTGTDRAEHDAVRAAAEYLRLDGSRFEPGLIPTAPTQLAVLAVQISNVFLAADAPDDPGPDVVETAVRAALDALSHAERHD